MFIKIRMNMNHFITRTYNKFEINRDQGTLTKISADTKLADEINYYNDIYKIPEIRRFFVNKLNSSIGDTNKMELEYIDYHNLYEHIVSTTETKKWKSISKYICNILKMFQSIKPSDGSVGDAHYRMYVLKTINEYNKLKDSNEYFLHLTQHENLIINGNSYGNFCKIQDKVISLVEKNLCKNAPKITAIHGDLCFGNIIGSYNTEKDLTSLKLLDPRGSWGRVGIYGDPRYDIAKLYHSCNGRYEYLTNKKYTLTEINSKEFVYEYDDDNVKAVGDILINDIVNEFPHNPADYYLIEGLIYIGMCARHYDCQKRQTIMYLTGVKILNEVLKKYEN